MNRWFDKLPIIGKKVPGKITLSFLMFIYAIILCLTFRTETRLYAATAMYFSFLGDIALNHVRDVTKQNKRDFILGGICFIGAHVIYCMAYYEKIRLASYKVFNHGSNYAIIILILITALFLIKNKFKFSKLFLFGLMYLWITGINYITIFSYSYSAMSIQSLAALGGIMFLASDVIIGMEKFLGLRSPIARELVWWLYPLGQILLITMA